MIGQIRELSPTLLACLLALIHFTAPGAQTPPAPATQTQTVQQTMPDGLLNAFLATTSQPYHANGEGRTTSSFGRKGEIARAWDGTDFSLESSSQHASSTVVLQVDEQGAAYPITTDPLVYVEQKVTSPDGAAQDWFGYSVALSGDTALMGAYGDDVGTNIDQGSVYVFTRSGSTWSLQQKLTSPDGSTDDLFGVSVALLGDTALAGAYWDDVGANINQGSVYVFTRSGTTWSLQAHLTASDGAEGDGFGKSVALSGDTALVGAPGKDFADTDDGSAYVFTCSGSSWSEQAQLTAADHAPSDLFGSKVALSGDTALVGAPGDNVGTSIDQGSAYVFMRSDTSWTQQAKLTALDGASYDSFGRSVALSGDTALVSAPVDDVGANIIQGSAYVFTRSEMTWTQQAKLTASDGAAEDWFGISVALSGDTALMGAYGDDVGGNDWQGSAYIFARSGTSWTQQAKLTASDGAWSDCFGVSVSLSGDMALVGADWDNVGENFDQGSAYFFRPDWFEIYLPLVLSF